MAIAGPDCNPYIAHVQATPTPAPLCLWALSFVPVPVPTAPVIPAHPQTPAPHACSCTCTQMLSPSQTPMLSHTSCISRGPTDPSCPHLHGCQWLFPPSLDMVALMPNPNQCQPSHAASHCDTTKLVKQAWQSVCPAVPGARLISPPSLTPSYPPHASPGLSWGLGEAGTSWPCLYFP